MACSLLALPSTILGSSQAYPATTKPLNPPRLKPSFMEGSLKLTCCSPSRATPSFHGPPALSSSSSSSVAAVVRFKPLRLATANSSCMLKNGAGRVRAGNKQWRIPRAAEMEMEMEEGEESEESESDHELEPEPEPEPEPVTSRKKAKFMMRIPKKQRLVLKFIWMEKNIGLALDQLIPGHGTIPLSPYYFWPRKDAWEELKAALESKPWISQKRTIILLNQATDIINLWQQSGSNI